MYAIAVRDGDDLHLLLRIRRTAEGDVYALFPREQPEWNPHSSYHASGRHHQKSFNYAAMTRDRQAPTAGFSGTENVVTFGVARDEPRAIGIPCVVAQFDAVLEIPIEELRPEHYRTALSVDLVEPGAPPIVLPTGRVLRQAVFDDMIPWIMLTLYDEPD